MNLKGEVLRGKIAAGGVLSAVIRKGNSLIGSLSKPSGYADYTGDYEVTPKVESQTMHTKDKHMTDDVKINAIPYFEVSNNAGGITIYIGKEV